MNFLQLIATVLVLLAFSFAQQNSYDDLLRHWDYDKSAPLNVRTIGTQERPGGVRVLDILYDSPVADRAARLGPNAGHVPAYLVVPAGKGPFPAIIYAHWCMPGSEMKNRKEFLDEAVIMASSGVVSLLPDHVTVREGFVADDSPLNLQQIDVAVQQVTNLRRGSDLLVTRRDVDPKRLAYVGHSCGGEAGAFLSGIDRRFKAFVIMAGGVSDDLLFQTKLLQDYRQQVGAEKFDAFNAKYSWTNVGKYIPHAAPAFVFMQYAEHEPLITPDLAKEYFATVSEPKKFKLYDAEHALNPEATRDRIEFLSEELDIKQPGSKDVASIPALYQPPWPKPSNQDESKQNKNKKSPK